MLEENVVESALEILRDALTSDGFDLRIGSREADNTVQVILEAKRTLVSIVSCLRI
jgi:hypothetical protein